MNEFWRFNRFFFHALARVWPIFIGLFVCILINAAAIAYFESIPIRDALYFSFITGLTIGYGDITPATGAGRIVAIMTGIVGILITGMVVAIAVYAVKETLGDTD